MCFSFYSHRRKEIHIKMPFLAILRQSLLLANKSWAQANDLVAFFIQRKKEICLGIEFYFVFSLRSCYLRRWEAMKLTSSHKHLFAYVYLGFVFLFWLSQPRTQPNRKAKTKQNKNPNKQNNSEWHKKYDGITHLYDFPLITAANKNARQRPRDREIKANGCLAEPLVKKGIFGTFSSAGDFWLQSQFDLILISDHEIGQLIIHLSQSVFTC